MAAAFDHGSDAPLTACGGGGSTPTASGRVPPIAAAADPPGVLTFTEPSSGSVHDVGLVAGGSIANGSLAVIEATDSNSPSNGIFGMTAQ